MEDIRNSVMPKIEALSEKVGDKPDVVYADFYKVYNTYVNRGMESDRAIKVAMNSVRSSYSKLIKLGAMMYEVVFVAGTETKDRNAYIRRETTEIVEQFKNENGALWKAKAIENGMINESGECLYTQEIIDRFCGGNPNLKWMIGRGMEVNNQKMAWAFIRKSGESDFRFMNVYVNAPDEFAPVFGKLYDCRAVVKTSKAGVENMTLYKTISIPTLSPKEFDFSDAESLIGELADNLIPFKESYDDVNHIGIMPQSPNPKFCITEVVIGSVSETGYGKKNVILTEQMAEFDDTPIEMDIPDEYSSNLYDGALGILVYRPFYRNKKDDSGNSIGKTRSGSILGFITDEKFMPVFDEEISDTPYQEEY